MIHIIILGTVEANHLGVNGFGLTGLIGVANKRRNVVISSQQYFHYLGRGFGHRRTTSVYFIVNTCSSFGCRIAM